MSIAYETLSNASGLMFMDSGAHSLYSREVLRGPKKGLSDYQLGLQPGTDFGSTKNGHARILHDAQSVGYAFYDTPQFWEYIDAYATFIKKHKSAIDFYVNVDAIFDPEASWRVLKYLETEHKLNPVPVVHYGAELKWLERHLDAGYEYIGIGGLGQEVKTEAYIKWADRIYTRLCPASNNYLPIVKTHGFAMTGWELVVRYPWFSVDSATWRKLAGFGGIYVPRTVRGKFCFSKRPYQLKVSQESPAQFKELHTGMHYSLLQPSEKKLVRKWLDEIEIPLGANYKDGTVKVPGVINAGLPRSMANVRYYLRLAEWVPDWPWPFKLQQRVSFTDLGFVSC